MDLRELTGKAAERIKSVFSKDNRFFYGSSNNQQQENYQEDLQPQSPVQGAYPYQQAQPQTNYNPNPYPQQPQFTPYQQPTYQQQPVNHYQAAPQPQYQAQPAYEQPQQHYQAASPQQAQLHQMQQQNEQTVRNRRAAQHTDAPAQDGNIVPFPGSAQEPEKQQMDAYVVNVTNINGCRQAMTCLRKGQCTLVVMDQLIDKAEVRRYVDMLNGACFALGGTMTRLSLKVGFYILAPNGMMVYTDPLTASANAPRQAQQPQPQQPVYQSQPAPQAQPQMNFTQDYGYSHQQPQQPAPAQTYQPYQQQPAQPYQQQAQPNYQQPQQQGNPYAPMNQAQQEYVLDPYDAQRYAQ